MTAEQNREYGLCPVVIGVSGHKDMLPQDREQVAAVAAAFFTDLKQRLPDTPLILLDALAEGVDRVVAHAALQAGIRLKVPLPLPLDLYRRELVPEQMDDFDQLLAQAEEIYPVPGFPDDVPQEDVTPASGYRRLAIHLATSSHILLAFWDGQVRAVGEGGTYDAVYLMLRQRGASDYAPTIFRQANGTVYDVRIARASRPSIEGPVLQPKWVFDNADSSLPGDQEQRRKAFLAQLSALDRYNREARARNELLGDKVGQPAYPLLQHDSGDMPGRQFAAVYDVANELSIANKKRYDFALRVNSATGFLMFLSFMIYGVFASKVALILYFALFLALVFYVTWNKKRGFHTRFIDYRSLAENMRIAVYWQEAGLAAKVSENIRFVHSDAFAWSKYALLSFHHLYRQSTDQPRTPERLRQLISDWVSGPGGQIPYLQNSVSRKAHTLLIQGKQAKILYALSLSTTFVILLSELTPLSPFMARTVTLPLALTNFFGSAPVQLSYRGLFSIIVSLIPAVTAIYSSYNGKLGLGETIRDHRKLLEIYLDAGERLDEYAGTGQTLPIQNILLDLGRNALIENGNWVLLNRGLNLSLPR